MFLSQNIINVPKCKFGSGENLPSENLLDKILEFLCISYVTRKLRVLCETGPRPRVLKDSSA